MKHKTRIYCADFVNAVHNCDRRSQFCERRSQFSIVNVGATPRSFLGEEYSGTRFSNCDRLAA